MNCDSFYPLTDLQTIRSAHRPPSLSYPAPRRSGACQTKAATRPGRRCWASSGGGLPLRCPASPRCPPPCSRQWKGTSGGLRLPGGAGDKMNAAVRHCHVDAGTPISREQEGLPGMCHVAARYVQRTASSLRRVQVQVLRLGPRYSGVPHLDSHDGIGRCRDVAESPSRVACPNRLLALGLRRSL